MGLLRSFDRCGKMRSRCETGEDPACICTRLERSWPTQTFGPSAGMAAKRTLATIHAANCIIELAAVAAIAFVLKNLTEGTAMSLQRRLSRCRLKSSVWPLASFDTNQSPTRRMRRESIADIPLLHRIQAPSVAARSAESRPTAMPA
jgi:hypothetical protein